MFGPTTIKKNGEFTKEQPGMRSIFWDAHKLWARQGRRTESDGVTCVYTTHPCGPGGFPLS
jgi:hypothetical protein